MPELKDSVDVETLAEIGWHLVYALISDTGEVRVRIENEDD
jgi:hypothetical protein